MASSNKQRTYGKNRLISRKGRENVYESDSLYLLKLVIVVFLGILWLRFQSPLEIGSFALGAFPIGFFIGLILVSRLEKLQFNRKIYYTVLLTMTVISYFASAGVVI